MTNVERAVRRHRAAEKRQRKAHEDLRDALRVASSAGIRQVDLVKATGYTREHIRRLLSPRTE